MFSGEEEEEAVPALSISASLAGLAVITVIVAVCSE
jgi:hypothetical protein